MLDAKLSLVLPAYNEAENIEAVVDRVLTVLPQVVTDFEVIVVNDGSADETGALINRLAAEHPRVIAVHNPVNFGYGGALRSGFAASDGNLVMFMDADRQFDIADITALLPYVGHYDIIAGYRIKRSDPAYRKLFKAVFELNVWVLFGIHIRDVDCAFKIYDGELLRSLNLTMRGALINTEMLALSKRRGARLVQVGVHHYPRQAGKSSGGSPKVVFRAMGETLRLRLHLQRMPPAVPLHPADEEAAGDKRRLSPVAMAAVAGVLVTAGALWMLRRRG
jgi:glycosyltransferase involved in cell wall biosynthesis